MGQNKKQNQINQRLNDILAPLNAEMQKQAQKNAKLWYEFELDMNQISTFSTVHGENFPIGKNTGIIFYGRVNNGWDEEIEDFEMENIDNKLQSKPFFKLMKSVCQHYYTEDWTSHIAWSNVYKLAPFGSREICPQISRWIYRDYNSTNPSDKLCDLQEEYVIKILKKEIEFLSPKVVVLVTGNTAAEKWDAAMECAFPRKKIGKSIWYAGARTCTATLYESEGIYFIVTDRPEFRPIYEHAECLINLIDSISEYQK